MVLGNASLGHSSVRFKPRRRGRPGVSYVDSSDFQEIPPESETTEACGETVTNDPETLHRAIALTELLLACDPPAPSGVPLKGRIVNFDAAIKFVSEHRRLVKLRGFAAALPKIVYHWTHESNFEAIAHQGLRVPDGGDVAVQHGSSFGLGVYVSPDFRYGREFFSYGATTAFMCLALPGRQHFGKPLSGGLQCESEAGFDSVVGREGQRGVDEWVFTRQGQLLPCFLVDKLGLITVKEAVHAAIKALHRPWPELDVHENETLTPAPETQAGGPIG